MRLLSANSHGRAAKPATNATSTNKDPSYAGNSDSNYAVLDSDWSQPETAGHGAEFIQRNLATEVLHRTVTNR